MIICDASAALPVLLNKTEGAAAARARLAQAAVIAAPELFDLEVLSAIKGHERRNRLHRRDAERAVHDLGNLRIRRFSHRDFRDAIFSLRHRHSIYDAAYVALAQALDAPLLTADAKLARAVPDGVRVELISP